MQGLYTTRNGQLCYPTGHYRDTDHTPLQKIEGLVYVEVDMVPLDPRRVEWVRSDNLRPFISKD